MPKKQTEPSRKVIIGAVVVLVLLIIVAGIWLLQQNKAEKASAPPPENSAVSVKNQPVIDYNQLNKDKALGDMMDERKAAYGVDKGLDMIVKADESVKIGDETVNMGDVQRKIHAKEGGIVEQNLLLSAKGPADAYGIYVVQPGDNIWNIHFKLLKDYFSHKGVDIAPMADEPDQKGFSSGVGKLLKFSENMAYIYNVKERALTADLNLIQPLSKIVVYDMKKAFDLLETIDFSKVHTIRFDGENIWIPAQQ
ncbi:MAG: hypothetical protein ABIL58_27985 [Pseudomonadota bacterium]